MQRLLTQGVSGKAPAGRQVRSQSATYQSVPSKALGWREMLSLVKPRPLSLQVAGGSMEPSCVDVVRPAHALW